MRIFLTVGTHPMSFQRLVKAVDELAAKRKGVVKVFAQIGSTAKTFKPKNISFRELLSPKELAKEIGKADVVVSHGGAGSSISILSQGKPLVVVPRRKKFNEHTDDHQIELCQAFARKGWAVCVEDVSQLLTALIKAKRLKIKTRQAGQNRIGQKIEQSLKGWGLV